MLVHKNDTKKGGKCKKIVDNFVETGDFSKKTEHECQF